LVVGSGLDEAAADAGVLAVDLAVLEDGALEAGLWATAVLLAEEGVKVAAADVCADAVERLGIADKVVATWVALAV
jgi:hypothetical protein